MIGSIWNRWDLYVHSPSSFTHNFKLDVPATSIDYENLLWTRYIESLELVDDVPAIGITDYFSIEGYKKLKDYRDQGRLSNFHLILPN